MSQLVDKLLERAFSPSTYRDQRSQEYKEGVRAALEYLIDRKKIVCPYPLGTAQADAFFSSLDEGHRIWREVQE